MKNFQFSCFLENISLQYDIHLYVLIILWYKKCYTILFRKIIWSLNITITITANMQELYNCYIGIVTNILRIKYKRKLKNKKSIFYEVDK